MSWQSHRSVSRVLVAAGATVVLAACSSAAPGPSGQAATDQPALPSQGAPAAGVPTAATLLPPAGASNVPVPVPSGGPSTSAAHVAACRDGQVRVTATGSPAAGSFLGMLTFQAVDGVTCTLRGYPGLDVTSRKTGAASGTTASAVRVKATKAESSVVLGRASYAVAMFGWVETPQGGATSCPAVVGLRVTPPGLHTTLQPAIQLPEGGQIDSELCEKPSISYVTRP